MWRDDVEERRLLGEGGAKAVVRASVAKRSVDLIMLVRLLVGSGGK